MPKIDVHSPLLSLPLATIIGLGATNAWSQSSDRTIEEIIVTAQKRMQTLKDVPSSVSALSEDYLEKTSTKNFSDIGKIASGIEVGGGADGFGRNIRIRGVGTNKYVAAVSPSVGVFVDDVPLVDVGVAFTNLAGIERIEVLKGPQSTLFGKGVSSGAISITTKAPETDVTEGYLEANIGNLGLQEYRAGGNIPLGDNFAIRGGLYTSERDGTIENVVFGNDGISSDNMGGRVRLLWDAADNLQFILGYQKHDLESNGTDAVIQSYGSVTKAAAEVQNVSLLEGRPYDRKTQDSAAMNRETESEISSLHVNWELNDEWNFASVTAYQEFSQGNAKSKRDDNSSDTIISPLVINHFNTNTERESLSQEFRANYDGDDLLSTIGVFYADSDMNTVTPLTNAVSELGGTPILLAIDSRYVQNTEEWAIFTNNTYTLTDRWDITFGLRYAEVEKTDLSATKLGLGQFAYLQSEYIPFASDWDTPTQNSKWDAITGGIKFTFDINEALTLYFGYDRGFKAGGHDAVSHNTSDPSNKAYVINPSFDSEYGDNYEVGLKGLFLDRTLSWNTSVFYQVYSDYQVNIPDPVTTFKIVNAADVVVQGIEMDFQWLAGEHLTIDGNFAYTDSRYDSYKNAGCNTPQYEVSHCTLQEDGTYTLDLSGQRLNLVSPWTANLNSTWNDQFSNGLQWFIRGELAFRDDRTASPDLNQVTRMPAYTLFNASMGLSAEDDSWSAMLWAKNLTDKDYLVSSEGNYDGGSNGQGGTSGFRAIVGEERTFGITLTYRFQ